MPRVGDLDVTILTESTFWLDGGAMFGVVPRTLWERCTKPDDRNRIRLAGTSLLVQDGTRTVIVDTGCGSKDSDKFRSIYALETCSGGLAGALATAGVSPEDVTDVVYTHLHFDHAGGGTTRIADGRIVPTFPRATFHVQKRQWEWATAPSERDRASYMTDNLAPLEASGRLRLHDGDGEILPGVAVTAGDNHCVGHQLVTFSSAGQTMVHCGDLIPTQHHVRLPYIMAYDLFPLATLADKQAVLKQAAKHDWLLVLEHDPVHPLVRVENTDKGIAVRSPVD